MAGFERGLVAAGHRDWPPALALRGWVVAAHVSLVSFSVDIFHDNLRVFVSKVEAPSKDGNSCGVTAKGSALWEPAGSISVNAHVIKMRQ